MDVLTNLKEDAFRPDRGRGMTERLQARYNVVLKQPLPPRLQELLERLDSVSTRAVGEEVTSRSLGQARQ